jgi:uncharacterized phiE125 gp8 family phage protein
MSLQLTTPPAIEPVTLAEAKAHLKLDTADEDALLTTLITAARARAEWHTGRAFITQAWTLRLDAWPYDGIAEIPLPPLASVIEVAVITDDGIRTVLDRAVYYVDKASGPGRLVLADTPPPRLRRKDCVEIAFTAGYGSATTSVPEAIREAILEIVADLHTHRGDEYGAVGLAGQALLAPYRVFKL